ncbi:MBOAT family O-acyltransferase [Engelhardtia mirabilis]|uniref:Peptidoglycan O-acetyltransferase n=1 Tax=Engelhardtia mirabilis TaxID=2528011 RepID=A0A518BM33_9BACT|nr:Peptidoglycan O-acetyltransferase [Planctomycetes bacterium Pla133]QDV02332.1 Peptidoglycan O-acetyltransferase [Planctomycetes bacterium Pla86]
MLFNSLHFLWFFALVWGVYWALGRRPRLQNLLLLAASNFFYGYWDWRFLGLIWASTLIDFACGLAFERPGMTGTRRRAVLGISLASNLGLLGFFKYFDFFAASAAELLASLGLGAHEWTLGVILPVGISFYTFQTLSYTIDRYRGTIPAERSLVDFATYVAFFPQLVAGPIVRAAEFLPQVRARRVFRWSDQLEGLELALWGLFKKVVLADNLAPAVNAVFAGGGDEVGYLARIVGVYAFTLQIYGDFSGYTDIARGCAQAMGFRFPWNFRMPYFASDPQEFWRRWHISLSSWLRDYLYISLGGNRGGALVTYRNLMLTMLLGGLWHGAAWNFVLWGGYQGLLLSLHRAWSRRPSYRPASTRLGAAVRWVCFLQLVVLGWLFFRAESMAQIVGFLSPTQAGLLAGLPLSEHLASGLIVAAGATLVVLAWDLGLWRRGDAESPFEAARPGARAAVLVGLYLAVSLFGRFVGGEFIYFQF